MFLFLKKKLIRVLFLNAQQSLLGSVNYIGVKIGKSKYITEKKIENKNILSVENISVKLVSEI